MTFGVNWTDEEVAALHEYRSVGLKFKEISLKLGRSEKACAFKHQHTRKEYEAARPRSTKITLAPVPPPRGTV